MRRNIFILFLLVALIFPLTSVAFSQDDSDIQIVDAEGTGIIINDDLASGRNSAIRDALQKAVEHVVVTLIPPKTAANKSRVIRDGIYAKGDEYVHDYRIISEKQAQTVYRVNVRSTLFTSNIKDDLKTLGLLKAEKTMLPVTTVAITIWGLKSYTDYVKVKELLKTRVMGVKNVYQRRFEWGMARLDLDIQGTVQSLTDEIAKTGHFSVKSNRMDQNYIEVTFLK
jgi:hypothetical protein